MIFFAQSSGFFAIAVLLLRCVVVVFIWNGSNYRGFVGRVLRFRSLSDDK